MYPQIITPIEQIDSTFKLIFGISIFILCAITFLMIFFLYRYHHTRNPEPDQTDGNFYLEILWTGIPLILVTGMFFSGWAGYKASRTVPPDAYPIEVSARMWSWNFKYPNGKTSTAMYVRQGMPVKVSLSSLDVIHSFYIPAFRTKVDALPGRETVTWFKPDNIGTFTIYCAEYCGVNHSRMLSKVCVLPSPEFDAWLKKLSEKPDTPSPGEKLFAAKGCIGCHSIDGVELAGPTFKEIYGQEVVILADGKEVRKIVDEEYLEKSIREPQAEIVKGFTDSVMPKPDNLSDVELATLVDYISGLK